MSRVFVSLLRGLAALALIVAVSACSSSPGPPGPVSSSTDISSKPSANGLYRVHLRVGQTALRNRDYATAAYFLQRAHSADKARVTPLLYLGRAHLALNNDDRAEATFRKILVLDNDHVEAHKQVAELLIKKGKYNEALIHLETALKVAPSINLHNRAGVVYDLSGNRTRAQIHYRAGLELDPNDTTLRNNLRLSRLKDEAPSRVKREQNGKNGPRGQKNSFLLGPVDPSSSIKNGDEFPKKGDVSPKDLGNKPDRDIVKAAPRRQPPDVTKPGTTKQVAKEPVPEQKMAKTPGEEAPKAPPMPKKTVMTIVPDKQGHIERRDTETNEVEKEEGKKDNEITTPYSSSLTSRQTTEKRIIAIPENSIPPPAMAQRRYSVQLAAYNNATTAWRGLNKLTASFDGKDAELQVLIRKRINGFTGKVKYRVRTTAWPKRARAVALCGRIKRRGGDCIIVRQTPGLWEPIAAPDTTMQAQSSRYRIQLGAYRNLGTTKRGLRILALKIGDDAPDLKILVRSTPVAPSSTNYRIRSTPFATRKAAQAGCDAIRAKSLDCLVILHNSGVWRSPG